MIAQQSGALEFQICGGSLHFIFELAQQFGDVEIAAGFLNDRRRDFTAAQNRVQTFLHRTSHGLRRDAMLLVVFHLFRAAIFRDRHERFHALGDLVGKQNHFAVDVARGAPGGLNQRSLAAQKSFLVRIEDADEGNLGKIETFAKQINADQNVEFGRTQAAQNFDALNRVDVAVQIADLESDITEIIGEIFRSALGQSRDEHALVFLHALTAKLNRLVNLIVERFEGDFWIEQSSGTNDLFDNQRRTGRVRVKLFRRLVGAGDL